MHIVACVPSPLQGLRTQRTAGKKWGVLQALVAPYAKAVSISVQDCQDGLFTVAEYRITGKDVHLFLPIMQRTVRYIM